MKFPSFSIVLASLALAASASAKSSRSMNSLLTERLQSGQFDQNLLLRNAVPYKGKQGHRHLENNNGNGNGNNNGNNNGNGNDQGENDEGQEEAEEAEDNGAYSYGYNSTYFMNNVDYSITGAYSATFLSCNTISMGLSSNDDENDLSSYMKTGDLIPARSYVLFNICETLNGCTYGQGHTSDSTYMVDLETFIESMINYMPNQKDAYCEGCEDQYDYCYNWFRSSEYRRQDQYHESYWMEGVKYQTVDCSMCASFGCYSEEDTYEDNGWDEVAEWITNTASCYETGTQWNDIDLYSGFMCNEYGTGIEVAMFTDDACTIYNKNMNYAGQNNDEYEILYKSKQIFEYLFNNAFDCYGGEVAYTSPADEQVEVNEDGWYNNPCSYNSENGGINDEETCMEMWQPNESCAGLFSAQQEDGNNNEDGDSVFSAIALSDCSSLLGSYYGNNDENDGNSNYAAYDVYYEISSADASNKTAICQFMLQRYESGEMSNVYDAVYSGSVFDVDYDMSDDWTADETEDDDTYGGYKHWNRDGGYFPTISGQKISSSTLNDDGRLSWWAISLISFASALLVFAGALKLHKVRQDAIDERLEELYQTTEGSKKEAFLA